MNTTKKIVITGMNIALCVVLPILFHGIPQAANILSPMHLPVLICGLICGWPYGFFCGLMGPLFSTLISGMPPLPKLPPMMIELASYGFFCGLMMSLIRTKKISLDIYISLITALVIGRIFAGASRALIFARGKYSLQMWIASYFVKCLPALLVQLILIPAIYFALQKAKLIPNKYEAENMQKQYD